MELRTKSGKVLHPIGIGTWNISGRINPNKISGAYNGAEPVYGNEDTEIEALRYSLSMGQNHIDCAEMYGGFYTDEIVGRAIASHKREDLFIGDKLWKTSVAKGKVRPAVEAMLQKLGTNYLDMLTIHAPWFDTPWQEAIPQIGELIDTGIVRYFGMSNFNLKRMNEVMLLTNHPVVANQMNFNVLHKTEVNQEFREFCDLNNIQLVAFQPLKRGEVLQHEKVQYVAQAHSATAAQIGLAWLLQQGILPIPKAVAKEHINENLDALSIVLSDEEIATLDAI